MIQSHPTEAQAPAQRRGAKGERNKQIHLSYYYKVGMVVGHIQSSEFSHVRPTSSA